jgi:serine/threonine-protein kinase
VVEIFDSKITTDTIFIVMEYVNGDTLRKILSKKKMLNINEAIFILKKILLVIKDIHNLPHKLIHRDLKPENIMLSED